MNNKCLTLLFILLIFRFSFNTPISLNDKFTLDYEVLDKDNDGTSDTIKFFLQSESLGYISIGYGGTTMLDTPDYAIGFFENGKPFVKDYTGSNGYSIPILDRRSQDFEIISNECFRNSTTT